MFFFFFFTKIIKNNVSNSTCTPLYQAGQDAQTNQAMFCTVAATELEINLPVA